MTVSLPSDITNGTLEELEEVFHTNPGGGERKDPNQPGNSSALFKPLAVVKPRRVGDPDPDVRAPATTRLIHNLSSSEDEMGHPLGCCLLPTPTLLL